MASHLDSLHRGDLEDQGRQMSLWEGEGTSGTTSGHCFDKSLLPNTSLTLEHASRLVESAVKHLRGGLNL